VVTIRNILETRIIDAESSLLVGDITLYHGTTWTVAKEAKRGRLAPQNLEEKVIVVLVNEFKVSSVKAKQIYDKYSTLRKGEPSVLFFTTDRKSAEKYARSTSKYGGEVVNDIVERYLRGQGIFSNEVWDRLVTSEPTVVTITVPLSMTLTHPYWNTPASKRILDIVRSGRKWNIDRDFDIEVFIGELIPAKYVQRIDRI
jgi:uncharacterized protein YifE (UPF0438 family)